MHALIIKGPFPVIKVYNQSQIIILQCPDRTIENVSRNRVFLAPKTKTKSDIMTEFLQMNLTDIVSYY